MSIQGSTALEEPTSLLLSRVTGGRSHLRWYLPSVLGPGDPVPDVRVWTAPGEDPCSLREVLGAGLSLLCFYLWDWSPT